MMGQLEKNLGKRASTWGGWALISKSIVWEGGRKLSDETVEEKEDSLPFSKQQQPPKLRKHLSKLFFTKKLQGHGGKNTSK